ncbi:unnamed protein product (macronuclear) [Paramecium tetraurelia]|uniref:HORMA domain-containing protein n=1 Tax=Paramecium tetraurelia TaxID=5888 RepID=A0BXG5_PARTE|nr:uncharacterized protein GSPATT00033085001 [Paramecium tetraurelia]CAK63232.1 unnamed protein product [Paramecium tetraurelia]|eukprot:XP_001430630.1 hypothetical protein (macronuclear) [Paramecium tetraurelia strain d4-2]
MNSTKGTIQCLLSQFIRPYAILYDLLAEWEDDMTYPVIEYNKFRYQAESFGMNLFLYAYNYNVITQNNQIHNISIPLPNCIVQYKSELTEVNLFDKFVQLRAQELVKENEILQEHEGQNYRIQCRHQKICMVNFADKQMIMQPQILKTQNLSYRISFEDTPTQIQQRQSTIKRREFLF